MQKRPTSFWFMQTAELKINLAMFELKKNYKKFHGKLVPITFESLPFLVDNSV